MAWKHNEQILARLAASVDYQPRLMAALERASKLYFDIEVRNGMFVVMDRISAKHTLPLKPETWEHLDALDSLVYSLGIQEAEQQEARRLAQVREAAIAKLSEEERTLLGLN